MGDRTNLQMTILSTDPAVLTAARGLFENYSGGDHYDEREEPTSLFLGGNEISVGSADELASDLDQLIAEEGTDFAYWVHEDPAYEWLGSVVIHVPGLTPDFTGQCDADGDPVLTFDKIQKVIDLADITDIRVELIRRSGHEHIARFRHLNGTTVAPQEVSPANQEGTDR